jgi:Transglycosylase SLT domain/SPOR domain
MPSSWRLGLCLSFACALATAALAQEGAEPGAEPAPLKQPATATAPSHTDPRQSICLMVEAAARANSLPVEFFARVIWQESRFQPDQVGPRTRSGERALGIAQFMPGTAAERGLLDPFDPVHALPKSAEFLHELRQQFGNLGLAAAAYNAGPQRVRDFLGGHRGLPAETRNYVLAITGTSVDEWAKGAKGEPVRERAGGANCAELMALLRRAPNPFVEQLEVRVNLVAARPWGVQLSAGFSRERALASYAGLANRYGDMLAGHDPSIQSTVLRSRGTRAFYQVRIGTDTRADADGLCGKIRRAGGACLVLRNMGGAG